MKLKGISDTFAHIVRDSKQRLTAELNYFTQRECNMDFSELLDELKDKLGVRKTKSPPVEHDNHDNMG